MKDLPSEYRPLSAWAYFGYNILFAIPVIGWIFLVLYAFDGSNINRRNFARSFFCIYVIGIIIVVIAAINGVFISN